MTLHRTACLLLLLALAAGGQARAQQDEENLKPLSFADLNVLAGPISPLPNNRFGINEPNTRALFRVERISRISMDIAKRRVSAWTRVEGAGQQKRRIGLLVCYIDPCNTDRLAMEFGDDLNVARLVYYKSIDFNFINEKSCKPVKFDVTQSDQFSVPDTFTLDFSANGKTHDITARLRNIILSKMTVTPNGYCEQFGIASDNLAYDAKISTDGISKPSSAENTTVAHGGPPLPARP